MPVWTIFILCSVTFWGVSAFVGKLTLNRGMTYIKYGAISSTGMALASLVFMLSFGEFHAQRWEGISLAMLSGIFEGVGTIVFYRALASGPASLVVPVFALYPAITLLLSFVVLGERLSTMQIVGVLFTFVAAFLLTGGSSETVPDRSAEPSSL